MSSPEPLDDAANIDATINCIEQFYHVDSHASVVRISLDRKLSGKLFGSDKVMMSKLFDSQNEDISGDKLQKYAEKYTYEKLVEKFANQRGISSVLRRILQYKVRSHPIESHKTRKQLWMLASGAKFYMNSNKGLYEKLLSYRDYPDYFSKPIDLDLNRTVQKNNNQTGQEDLDAMRRLLLCFSRRNPFIGYCQGLNFIAHFILTMQFDEEEGFWLLSMLVENVIPIDYYTNMLGVVCDQRILAECIRLHLPRTSEKFKEVGIDPSLFSIEWFVCMFTSSMPFYLVRVVWDRLILQGMSALIKTGLILLQEFEPEILQAAEFPQIIMTIEERAKRLSLKEDDFNARFDRIYLNSRGLKLARDLYRQLYLKEKLAEKVIRNRPLKLEGVVCRQEWPICIHALQHAKRDRRQVHVWTMRQRMPPNFIVDYWQVMRQLSDKMSNQMNRKRSQTNNNRIKNGEELRHTESSCPTTTLTNINGSDFPIRLQGYEDELIIGRMAHVCDSEKPINENGAIQNGAELEKDSCVEQPRLKRKERSQEPMHRSELILHQMEKSSRAHENLSYLLHDTEEQKPHQIKDLRSKLRDSHAVGFMKRFVIENKELGEIITSG